MDNNIKKELGQIIFDGNMKGFPNTAKPVSVDEISSLQWNILKQDTPFPVAILQESTLTHNSKWMSAFASTNEVSLCPHGKTTMSPQLFHRQLDEGAWGITVATIDQMRICRNYGINRVLLANQLMGKQSIRYVLDELHQDSSFEFYCLVDSIQSVQLLLEEAKNHPIERSLTLLLEVGFKGGRTGCRTIESALEVAGFVKENSGVVSLVGVESYEGLIVKEEHEERQKKVKELFEEIITITKKSIESGFFTGDEIILSAGGSAYYDMVVEEFKKADLSQKVRIIIRSGCYLTHDIKFYHDFFLEVQERSEAIRNLETGLKPALEVWAIVQSLPEPELAIVTMGKRDVSFDVDLPKPIKHVPSGKEEIIPLNEDYTVTALNDQHGYLSVPKDHSLQVGDLIGFGISHPCTTFDRWQLLYIVDDSYNVTSAIKTFF